MVKLPKLTIGNLVARLPIIQGGMAVRISTSSLAAAVAEEGAIGVIAGSGLGVDEFRQEIRRARQLTKGIIGVNIMVAVREFANLVKTALQEKIDLIIAGAGFSRDVFGLGKEAGVPIVPIVSSVKLAKIAESLGAAAVVVEGKEAGGHLGTDQSVKILVPEIKKNVSIPVFAAGGIITGRDIVEAFKLGADGVQMATRFVASNECNAALAFKQAYLSAQKDDIVLIESPVGLPGRAIRNRFTEKISGGQVLPPEQCVGCLKKCRQNFCIMDALVKAQQGEVVNGLVFSGEYVYKVNDILPVKEIIANLIKEVEETE